MSASFCAHNHIIWIEHLQNTNTNKEIKNDEDLLDYFMMMICSIINQEERQGTDRGYDGLILHTDTFG